MTRRINIISLLIFLASIPFLYFVITDREHNWLYNVSLTIILAGAAANMILDWRKGNKKVVKRQLLSYAVIVAICLALVLIFD